MNADQIAEICPALREAVEGAPDACATLSVEGHPERWMQLVDRTINAAYQYSDSPKERMCRLDLPPLVVNMVSRKAGKFATFEFAQVEIKVLAEWIDAYFVHVMGCTDGEYHLDVTLTKL